jgi:hypothetical protein
LLLLRFCCFCFCSRPFYRRSFHASCFVVVFDRCRRCRRSDAATTTRRCGPYVHPCTAFGATLPPNRWC